MTARRLERLGRLSPQLVALLLLQKKDDETIWRLAVVEVGGAGWREGEGGVATRRPKRLLSSAARCEGQTDARRRGEQTNELHISRRERKRREEKEEGE